MPWDGIVVRDLRIEDRGSVSFVVDPIEYPRTYESPIRMVGDDGSTTICTTSWFRPWARTGEVTPDEVSPDAACTSSRGPGLIEAGDETRPATPDGPLTWCSACVGGPPSRSVTFCRRRPRRAADRDRPHIVCARASQDVLDGGDVEPWRQRNGPDHRSLAYAEGANVAGADRDAEPPQSLRGCGERVRLVADRVVEPPWPQLAGRGVRGGVSARSRCGTFSTPTPLGRGLGLATRCLVTGECIDQLFDPARLGAPTAHLPPGVGDGSVAAEAQEVQE